MHNPWRSLPLLPYKRDSGPQEIEALQTDIMRFMAILGLVLMAIFALVQSLQVGPTEVPGQHDDPQQLRQEEARLKRQLHQLQQQLLAAENQLKQARNQAEHFQQQASLEAQKAEQELDRTVHSLQQTTQALREQERRLARLNRQITQRHYSREELDREIEAQQGRLAALEQELNAVRQQRTAKAIPAKPSRSGFSLRFASDESLTFLANTQQVQVYAMTEKRTWTWEPGPRNARFRPAGRPNKFYEMDPETVPQPYLMALRKIVTGIDPSQLTWGVILPEPTRQQIAQFMGQHAGGDLVIQKDGSVSVDP
jgi:multidrug efflux pump subunit AcrA (membrane-fusion protein)